MESIPGLKKCFEFVAGLSKKILGNTPQSSLSQPTQKGNQKSPSDQNKTEQPSIKPILSFGLKQTLLEQKSSEMPKVICFQSYMQGKPKTLNPTINQLTTNNKYSYIHPINHNLLKNTTTQFPNRKNSNLIHHSSTTFVDNNNKNQTSQLHRQTLTEKRYQKHLTQAAPPKKVFDQSSDGSEIEESDQEIILSKKSQKQLKKISKTPSQTESLQPDTDELIFTYEDGDDISSIAAKSETTDEIEPQLLSFITKRGNFYFNKLEEPKIIDLPTFNMKKKGVHLQGETVEVKSPKKKEGSQCKKQSLEAKSKPSPKKRAFELYPGQTFEQFKKRILVQQQPQSSQSDQIEDGVQKIIKKQQYQKILDHMSRSMSRMQEQKCKEASILVVEKMVDESENQESKSNQSPPIKFLEEIDNYKVWNNAADNPSFKVYFRNSQ